MLTPSRNLAFLLALALPILCGRACRATEVPGGPRALRLHHLVIVVQENRSFDNLFNGFPGADSHPYGLSRGKVIRLRPVPLEFPADVNTAIRISWPLSMTGRWTGSTASVKPRGKMRRFPTRTFRAQRRFSTGAWRSNT